VVRPNPRLISRQEANQDPSLQKLVTSHHKKTIKSNYTQTSRYVNKHELERRETNQIYQAS